MGNIFIAARIFFIIGICIIFLYFYVHYLESRSIYYPTRDFEGTPLDIKLRYEDVYFSTADKVKLHGWWIPAKTGVPVLIFCHGNGRNISNRLEKILFFNQLELNVFIFDYRGYGKSMGKPSEHGLYQDVQAAYNYVKQKNKQDKNENKIILYGESLGGAVAVDLASKFKVEGLVLEGTFPNTADMAKIIYPFLPSFFIKSNFDSVSKIGKVKSPKLFMHSIDDEMIPFTLGLKLFKTASPPKEFLELEGGHNDAFFVSEQKIKTAIEKFLQKI